MTDPRAPATPPRPDRLPPPPAQALALSARLQERILDEIDRLGAIGFDRYMELALYTPGLGYYVNGLRKFGQAGDFVTAPEVSALFSRCLARQCAEVIASLGGGAILELGGGSGVMAADLLGELAVLGHLPDSYLILELSGELRARQQATIKQRVPHLIGRVGWLDRMPKPAIRGCIVANEVLDAMPVHRFRRVPGGVAERVVTRSGNHLVWATRPAGADLAQAVAAVEHHCGAPLAAGYESEINLRLAPWLRALAGALEAGALLLIDYGYPRREYYRAERREGTLICHYRHRAHSDPLRWPGLQDVSANVDFTAAAEAALAAGFEVAGFASQAQFLLATGLDELLAASDPGQTRDHLMLAQQAKTLILPSEMGERFKVLGLTRHCDQAMRGFGVRDLRHQL
jgi:SAM-dependent MidA family methyltransferase